MKKISNLINVIFAMFINFALGEFFYLNLFKDYRQKIFIYQIHYILEKKKIISPNNI